jgi:hypothetical protein
LFTPFVEIGAGFKDTNAKGDMSFENYRLAVRTLVDVVDRGASMAFSPQSLGVNVLFKENCFST